MGIWRYAQGDWSGGRNRDRGTQWTEPWKLIEMEATECPTTYSNV